VLSLFQDELNKENKMNIEIVKIEEAGKTLYQVKANGIVLASSFDEKVITERAYYVRLGAEAMLKHININLSVKSDV
jgi:uncharacterized protein (DUF427 family)